MSYVPTKIPVFTKFFLKELQELCKKHKAEITGVFAVRLDREQSFENLSTVSGDTVECWGQKP